ncbi:hypothetical protein F5Y13DRAFT_2032 [Hypoxylon sp. FL1857]|nr:hypothetical protein F5Y13DRAFT_2032 [Hypoxylon sp. FL1857]
MGSASATTGFATSRRAFVVDGALLTVAVMWQHTTKLLVNFQYESLRSCHVCGLYLTEDAGDELMISNIDEHPQLKILICDHRESQFCQCDTVCIGKASGVERESKLSRSGLRKRPGQANSIADFIQRQGGDTISHEANIVSKYPLDQGLLILATRAPMTLADQVLVALANWGHLQLMKRLMSPFPCLPSRHPRPLWRYLKTGAATIIRERPSRFRQASLLSEIAKGAVVVAEVSHIDSPVEPGDLQGPPEPDSIESMINTSEQASLIVQTPHSQAEEFHRSLISIRVMEKRTYTMFLLASSRGFVDTSEPGNIALVVGRSWRCVWWFRNSHRSNCRCWSRGQALPMWEIHNGFRDSNPVRESYGHRRMTLGQDPMVAA